MKLKTISNVKLGDGAECWLKCFHGIKKLTCPLYTYDDNDFKSLAYLESLKLIGSGSRMKSMEVDFPKGESIFEKNHFTMPATIKKLTLLWCRLPWSDILIIRSLPNLEELNLLDNAFEGPQWDTVLLKCNYLEEVPLEIGDISTLELIETDDITSIVESLDRMQEEQHNVGNYDLEIRVHRQT
ncbi:unnamed protein product [Lactuca virosa]|uniref:Uncharacterized protein n=1 Tax=Lactuca virosa TaxID=75947 RepID=A0AAU9LHV5_9ASTR|nr:unnamed protein product [Lactuca virosa]